MSPRFIFDVITLHACLDACVKTLGDWPGYNDRQLRIQVRAPGGSNTVEFRTPPAFSTGRYQFALTSEASALTDDLCKSLGARQFYSAIDKLITSGSRRPRLGRRLVMLTLNEQFDTAELSLAIESDADLISEKLIEPLPTNVEYELALHHVSEVSYFDLMQEVSTLPAIHIAPGLPAPVLSSLVSYVSRLAQPQRYYFALRVDKSGALLVFNSVSWLRLLPSQHAENGPEHFPVCVLDKNILVILHKLLASKATQVAGTYLLLSDEWLYLRAGSLLVRLPTSAPHLLPRSPELPDNTQGLFVSLHELKKLLAALDVAYEKARDIVMIEAKSAHKLQLTFSDEAQARATIKVRGEVPSGLKFALTRSLLARAIDCLPEAQGVICLSALGSDFESICVSDQHGQSFVWVPKINHW